MNSEITHLKVLVISSHSHTETKLILKAKGHTAMHSCSNNYEFKNTKSKAS